MRQFCPKCNQLHDAYSRFCPKCDIVMYQINVYENCIKNNQKLKIINRKKAYQIKVSGTIITVIGIASFILGVIIFMIFADDFFASKNSIVPFIMISFLLFTVGITLFCLGLYNLGEYARIYQTFPDANSKSSPTQPISCSSNRLIICCPYCKSQNTIKLDTLDRMGSILLVGAASGKLGKQWHCNNCKSDF